MHAHIFFFFENFACLYFKVYSCPLNFWIGLNSPKETNHLTLSLSERLDCKETGVFLRLRFALLGPTRTRAEEKRKSAAAEKRKFPPTRTVSLIL